MHDRELENRIVRHRKVLGYEDLDVLCLEEHDRYVGHKSHPLNYEDAFSSGSCLRFYFCFCVCLIFRTE